MVQMSNEGFVASGAARPGGGGGPAKRGRKVSAEKATYKNGNTRPGFTRVQRGPNKGYYAVKKTTAAGGGRSVKRKTAKVAPATPRKTTRGAIKKGGAAAKRTVKRPGKR